MTNLIYRGNILTQTNETHKQASKQEQIQQISHGDLHYECKIGCNAKGIWNPQPISKCLVYP